MKRILEQINTLVPLSPATERALRDCLTPCRFPRRHLLVQADHRTGAASKFLSQDKCRAAKDAYLCTTKQIT